MHIDAVKYLSFGTGGMNGWIHVGVLSAVEKELIKRGTTLATRIRGVSGASVGSLVAVAVALSMSSEEIKAFYLDCTERYLTKAPQMNVMDLLSKKGLHPTTVLANVVKDLLARKFGEETRDMTLGEMFKLTEKACYITAHNITKTRGEVLHHTTHPHLPVHKAVCMSCALPGIFEPVEHDGSLYIDSGLSNELPFEVFNDMESTLAIYLVGDLKHTEPSAMTLQDYFYRITCAFSLNTEAKINALPQHLKSQVLWLRVPCLFGRALKGFALADAEREKLIEIGFAAGETLVHFKMAVLSQAATLYISSRRGLGVTVHTPPKIADVLVGGDPAAPDRLDVPGEDLAQVSAAVDVDPEPEPQRKGVLEEVYVDAAKELVSKWEAIRRGEPP